MNTSTTLDWKTNNNNLIHFAILILITLFVVIASILIGAASVPISDVIKCITGQPVEDYVKNIVMLVRVPRTLSGFICGSALAVSGLLLQTALNNALASPSTIGVNTGAGLFVLISTLLFPFNYLMRTGFAFIGAVLVALIIYFISVATGRSRMTIILAGVAVTTMCSAIIDCIVIIFPDSVFDKTAFYIGGLSGITYTQIAFSSIFILIGITIIMFFHKQVDILILGDEISNSLGVNANRVRFIVIICASLMAGASVAIAGLLSFVGLIVPHIASILFDNDSKTLIPKTALLGGSFLVFADLIARIIFTPYEIPVGVVLSFLGAPFFLYLLFNGKKKGRFV